MAFQFGAFQLGAFQIISGVTGSRKKKLDLSEYNRYVLSKMLSEEAEQLSSEPEDQAEQEAEKDYSRAPLGIFEPVTRIEAAMPRVIDTLTSQGAEDVIPLLRAVYDEMMEKAKAEAIELEDIEILLLAA